MPCSPDALNMKHASRLAHEGQTITNRGKQHDPIYVAEEMFANALNLRSRCNAAKQSLSRLDYQNEA